jgi:uroporphyrinogen-III synthase
MDSTNPLKGKRVVVTRAWHQSSEFAQKLEATGAQALLYPCVEIIPPAQCDELDANLRALFANRFDWLLLTSQNTVLALSSRIKALGLDASLPTTVRVAAVGPATAHATATFLGVDVGALPQVFDAESLAQLVHSLVPGQKVLLPQADIASPMLENKLRESNAKVVSVVAYQTIKGSGGAPILDPLKQGLIDVITFASPSAVRFFIERLIDEGGNLNLLKGVCIACIGKVTQKAAFENGLHVSIAPLHHTIDALMAALEEYFGEHISDLPNL